MFVSERQIYYFSECVFVGIICGLIYLPFFVVRSMSRKRAVGIITDVLFAAPCCFVYSKAVLFFDFPNFRLYMIAGVILGFLLENSSFNKTLAFLAERVYNKIGGKVYLKLRNSKLRRKHGVRKQVKKTRRRGNGYGGYSFVRADSGYGVSTYLYGDEKERSGKTSIGDNGTSERNRGRGKRNRNLAQKVENRGESKAKGVYLQK